MWPFSSKEEKALSPVSARSSWWPIFESYNGAWQSNVEVDRDSVLANPYVFACQALISRDISKLRVKLVAKTGYIWNETQDAAHSPLLRKPNPMQTRNQFWETWILSKLSRGNTFVLKRRDARGKVVALYILDPDRVTPLVSDQGAVFYDLRADNIAGIEESIVVPASEVIHDRYNCLYHPLVGLSPIFAHGVTATQGLSILDNSATFFSNASRPGGLLTAPGSISKETADRLKTDFQNNFSGVNAGKVAIVGDGLKFEQMSVSAKDTELVQQFKMTAETIAAVYGIPLYKLGLGPMPTAGNVQSLHVEYYSQCLQGLIEDAESVLDEGLGLDGVKIKTQFDTDNLLRMDSLTHMQVLKEGVGAGIYAPNEARRELNLNDVAGGESPFMQEQNWSLADLAERRMERELLNQPTDDLPDEAAKSVFRDELTRALT